MGHNGILVIGGKSVVASDSNNGSCVGEVVPGGDGGDQNWAPLLHGTPPIKIITKITTTSTILTWNTTNLNNEIDSYMQSPVSVVVPEVYG